MSISFDNIRTNKSYSLTNHAETYEFVVLEIRPDNEFLLRDVHTLEPYLMSDLLLSGMGNDYCLLEI